MFKTCKKPPMSIISASGDVCSFKALQAGIPLKSHVVQLTATQSGSGTPSPQNIRSINGHSALNISRVANNNLTPSDFAISTSGRTMTYSNEAYSIVPTTNTQSSFILTNAILDYMNVIEAGTYKIDVVFTDDNYSISGVYADLLQSDNTVKQVINGETFTISNSFRLQDLRATLFDFVNGVNMNFKIFITKLADLQYVSINLGGTYYGGEYDARTGVLRADVKGILARDVTGWAKSGNVYYRNFPDVYTTVTPDTPTGRKPLICSHFDYSSSSIIADLKIGYGGANNNGNIVIRYDALSTISDFNDYITNNDVFIVYPLATPTTIQLPPCPINTLNGVNNIWADTGDTSLSYNDLNIAKRGSFREVFKIPTY